MATEKNYFEQLYAVQTDKIKQKNGLNYAPWSVSWSEVKKRFPDATYKIYEEDIEISETIGENTVIKKTVKRPWFDDGKTGWVKTGVTINGVEHIEELPIMDFKNKSIDADKITSCDANKSIQRSITKACARHGCLLHIFEGEDLPEEIKEVEKIVAECYAYIKKKTEIGKEAAQKVAEACKETLPSECNGDPKLCEDLDVLKTLKKKLMAIR